MRIRIVVADQSEARVRDTIGNGRVLIPVRTLRNPMARLQDREIEADRPGSTLARAGGARHAVGKPSTLRRRALRQFATRIARDLAKDHDSGRFDRLVIIAGPTMLGELRGALPTHVKRCIATTLVKDVLHRDDWDVRAHIPREVFTSFARAGQALHAGN
jgi:protein required for attachment to host cells